MKKAVSLVLIATILLSLSGCWDWRELEQRGFVLGMALDAYPPNPKGGKSSPEEASQKEEQQLEQMQLTVKPPLYAMTIQLPLIKKGAIGVAARGSGKESATWELTQIGNSFESMNRELLSRTTQRLYFDHLQVIIISEKLAEQGLEEVLDYFARDPAMRRRTRLFICQGEAKKILDVIPRNQDYSSLYLAKIPQNETRNSKIIHGMDLGDTLVHIHSNLDFMLPRVKASEDEIQDLGAAVFKNNKMVGWLEPLDLQYVSFLHNEFIGGVEATRCPVNPKVIIVLEISKSTTKVSPVVDGDQITFDVAIDIQGSFAESVNSKERVTIDEKYLKKAEEAFAQQIEERCQEAFQKVQAQWGTDIMGFGGILKIKKPTLWKKIKKDWDEIFPQVKVRVKANVHIEEIGNTAER